MSGKKIGFGFKGKYCASCNTVWEMITSAGSPAGVVRHPDFPSYGLEREDCHRCTKAAPKPEETGTKLAKTQHKELLQRIADETQEMIRKNDIK